MGDFYGAFLRFTLVTDDGLCNSWGRELDL